MAAIKTNFTLWEHLVGTVTSANYYLHVQEFSVWTSLKVFAVGMILAGLIFSLRLAHRDIPQLLLTFEHGLDQVVANYPPSLVVTWDGTSLTTTEDQARSLAYPAKVDTEYLPPHFMYYTPTPVASDQVTESPYDQHLVVVTPTLAYIQNANGGWSELPLTELPGFDQPFTLTNDNKETIKTQLVTAIRSLKPTLTLVLFLISPLIMTINTFIQGVLDIFLLYLLLRLYRFRLNLTKVFQLCLHIWIVAQIVNQITLALYPQLSWSFFSITFWVVTAYLLFSWNRSLMRLLSNE